MSNMSKVFEEDYNLPRGSIGNAIATWAYMILYFAFGMWVVAWGWNTVLHDILGLPPLVHLYQVFATWLLLKAIGRAS